MAGAHKEQQRVTSNTDYVWLAAMNRISITAQVQFEYNVVNAKVYDCLIAHKNC